MNVGSAVVSISPSSVVVGPDTLIVKAPPILSFVVFLIVSDANFSLTNSQTTVSVAPMSISPVSEMSIGSPPSTVHSADTCLHPSGMSSVKL